MYIYSWSGNKNKTFSQCPSVRLSAKLMYTKTWERIKINACGFFVWKEYPGNRILPNEIFKDFAISCDSINEIDPDFFYFKDMDYKLTPNRIGPDHMKCAEVGAEWKSYS